MRASAALQVSEGMSQSWSSATVEGEAPQLASGHERHGDSCGSTCFRLRVRLFSGPQGCARAMRCGAGEEIVDWRESGREPLDGLLLLSQGWIPPVTSVSRTPSSCGLQNQDCLPGRDRTGRVRENTMEQLQSGHCQIFWPHAEPGPAQLPDRR